MNVVGVASLIAIYEACEIVIVRRSEVTALNSRKEQMMLMLAKRNITKLPSNLRTKLVLQVGADYVTKSLVGATAFGFPVIADLVNVKNHKKSQKNNLYNHFNFQHTNEMTANIVAMIINISSDASLQTFIMFGNLKIMLLR